MSKEIGTSLTGLKRGCACILLAALMAVASVAVAAPKADLWPYWDKSNPGQYKDVDHSAWNKLLSTYVITNHPSGINRFRYAQVTRSDKNKLGAYIKRLAKEDPRLLSKRIQKAYWLNLYNALTVQLILKHYPIKSITKISGGGLLTPGPWDKKVVKITGKWLTLNDIEHRILRPIWQDHRIHFGLNCASLGCPDLLPVAFTASNTRKLLVQAGKDYIGHSRGLFIKNGKMKASSLFKWYRVDFAKDEKTLKKVLAHYAVDKKALYLLGHRGDIDYDYDWQLNEP